MKHRLRTIKPPADGLWRVGRGDDPLRPSLIEPDLLADVRAGNRFDSPDGSYGVTYLGSSLECCFGETLARLRPKPRLAELVTEEWQELNFMEVGAVAAEWRQRRTVVRVDVAGTFVDIEPLKSRERLRQELAAEVEALDLLEFDLGTMKGKDRRPTRLVSQWVHDQDRYAGIRYHSRLNSGWDCWAVFEGTPMEIIEAHAIDLDMPDFRKITDLYGLHPH